MGGFGRIEMEDLSRIDLETKFSAMITKHGAGLL
jgi:hypothetical protein